MHRIYISLQLTRININMTCVIWLLIVINQALTSFADSDLSQESFWSDVNSVDDSDQDDYSLSSEHFEEKRHIKFYCKHFMLHGQHIYCDEKVDVPFKSQNSIYERNDIENVTCLSCSKWASPWVRKDAFQYERLWVRNETNRRCYHKQDIEIYKGCQCSHCDLLKRHPGKCTN